MSRVSVPFFGEFGWEVAMWAPFLRACSKVDKLTVICRVGHSHLYEDFAESVVEVAPPDGKLVSDCQNSWFDGIQLKGDHLLEFARTCMAPLKSSRIAKRSFIEIPSMSVIWNGGEAPSLNTHRHIPKLLGNKETLNGVIGIHARAIDRSPVRNWSRENWEQLVSLLPNYTVRFFGTSDDFFIDEPCTFDFRGMDVRRTCEAMSQCEIVVGASSGPMPLANYSGTRVLWWSGNVKDVGRYRSRCWNPFNKSNMQVGVHTWNPSVSEVIESLSAQGFNEIPE